MGTHLAGGQTLLERLPGPEEVLAQEFRFRPAWWTSRVPATWSAWLNEQPEDPSGREYRRISRGRMLDTADGAEDWELRTLLATYVWGTGHLAFLVGRRARTFRDTEPAELASRLAQAAESLGTMSGAVEAYGSMLHRGRANVKHLGPAFFTKFLYAADFGARDQLRGGDALIMDRFVVRALNDLHDWSAPDYGPWSADLYERWLDIAAEQAWLAAIELGRTVRSDEIEYAYFKHGKSLK